MAGTEPDQEPSIEEILASIRQIISDDETREAEDIEIPREENVARKAGDIEITKDDEKYEIPVYQPEPEQEEEPRESFADVLELTNEIKGDKEEKVINYSEEKYTIPLAEPDPVKEEAPRKSDLDLSMKEDDEMRESDLDLSMGSDDIDALFTAPALAATADAFSKLMGNIPVEREENERLYADGRITLEDIAKDLMRPMLRQWIDDNVPKMVERLIQKEIEKITKQIKGA
ncbi:MAG: hypothetical protein AUJ12_06920 [Alphaproteobacteria bacterium CG1_02_46_17]|nr:MAG: hypothetical protein AUJ12_06920 [Alphaproteobacteria bacterium CG1_02_46_17]